MKFDLRLFCRHTHTSIAALTVDDIMSVGCQTRKFWALLLAKCKKSTYQAKKKQINLCEPRHNCRRHPGKQKGKHFVSEKKKVRSKSKRKPSHNRHKWCRLSSSEHESCWEPPTYTFIKKNTQTSTRVHTHTVLRKSDKTDVKLMFWFSRFTEFCGTVFSLSLWVSVFAWLIHGRNHKLFFSSFLVEWWLSDKILTVNIWCCATMHKDNRLVLWICCWKQRNKTFSS